MNEVPFDEDNHDFPDFMSVNEDQSIIGPEGIPLSSKYIWSKKGEDRVSLMEWVFNYYRTKGLSAGNFTDEELLKDFQQLKNNNVEVVDGKVSHSASCGLKIVKKFTSELYLNAKGGPKTLSCLDVFLNDEKFKKVLKNRMGWVLNFEDGYGRPLIWNITDKMIFQGMRSSGVAYTVSQFKPAVAKMLYKRYNVKKTFDPSAGWGARAIAAVACGVEYYATDPLTSSKVNNLITFFNGKGTVFNSGSEIQETYKDIPTVDFIFTSPPYFNLEVYSDNSSQSIESFPNYSEWLDKYWSQTVDNCLSILEGKFAFTMIETIGKNEISKDMINICLSKNLKLIETIDLITQKSHLSNKKTTKLVSKNTEHIYIFER